MDEHSTYDLGLDIKTKFLIDSGIIKGGGGVFFTGNLQAEPQQATAGDALQGFSAMGRGWTR